MDVATDAVIVLQLTAPHVSEFELIVIALQLKLPHVREFEPIFKEAFKVECTSNGSILYMI